MKSVICSLHPERQVKRSNAAAGTVMISLSRFPKSNQSNYPSTMPGRQTALYGVVRRHLAGLLDEVSLSGICYSVQEQET